MDSIVLSEKVVDRLGGKAPMVWSDETKRYELELHQIVLLVIGVLVDEGFLAYDLPGEEE